MTTVSPSQPDVRPHRFSTEEYLHMIDTGVLGPDDKVELIHGIICDMTPAGTPRHETLDRLVAHFAALRHRFRMRVQGTTVIAGGQVYDPDLLLLTDQSYWDRHPQASDIHLVIEVAASSLHRDLKVKLPIYAAAGVGEYWVAECDRATLHVHRDPTADCYASVQSLAGDQTLAPLAAPDLPLRVGDLFG